MSLETFLMVFGSTCEAALLPTLVVVFMNRRFWRGHPPLQLLSIFLMLSLLQFCITFPNDIKTILTGEKYFNSLFLYNWHNVLTTFIIIAVYYKLLTVRHKGLLCVGVGLIFVVFTVMDFSNDSLTNFSTVNFNTYTYNVTNLAVVLLCLLYAYQVIQNLEVEDITRYSYFWLNAGFLVYYAGSMFVYLYMLVAGKKEAQVAWIINSVLLLTFYLAVSLAYYCSKNLRQR